MKFIDDNGNAIPKSFIKVGVLVVILLVVVFNLPFLFIPVGYRGVQIRLGNTTGNVYQQGINARIPFIDSSRDIEVRTQKIEVNASSASKDLQTVSTKVALNFSLDEKKIVNLYQTVGDDYGNRIIAPALQESVKSITAKFTAEELITKRSEVSDGIKTGLIEKLSPRGIVVENFSIVDFDFSKSFNEAIERKVTAEQNALASKNQLEQVKYEAEQRIAQAKGEAEAIRIQSEAIQSNGGENYVQLKAIEKWTGTLPTYLMGNSIPLVNIK